MSYNSKYSGEQVEDDICCGGASIHSVFDVLDENAAEAITISEVLSLLWEHHVLHIFIYLVKLVPCSPFPEFVFVTEVVSAQTDQERSENSSVVGFLWCLFKKLEDIVSSCACIA